MATRSRHLAGFFEIIAWIMLALVIAGFGALRVMMPDMASPMRPTLLLHTGLFLAWFILLIVQPRLIAAGNIRRHKQIGKASGVLAFAMVIAGLAVMREAYFKPGWSIAGMSPQASIMFPFTDMVFFPIAYALAIHNRLRPNAHKRFMLFAGMVMLDPALARLIAAFGLFPPLIMAVELALVASVIVHDRWTLGRIHSATWFGAGLIALTYPLAFVVAPGKGWAALVTNLLGTPPAP